MSSLVCKNCKSIAVEYEDYVGGTSYYRCKTCGMRGDKDKFTQVTLFNRITASPEVLAPLLVREYWMADGPHIVKMWVSKIVPDHKYKTEPEAISVTVAKLKEVHNETASN